MLFTGKPPNLATLFQLNFAQHDKVNSSWLFSYIKNSLTSIPFCFAAVVSLSSFKTKANDVQFCASP